MVNLHWTTTKNVNLVLESTNECKSDCVVDLKDAKIIICGEIQPVQNPGKSWKQRSYPDHTFDQSHTIKFDQKNRVMLQTVPIRHSKQKQ